MEHLALAMSSEFGRGFSATNLRLMRQFYLVYSPRILQTASDESALLRKQAGGGMASLAALSGLASISWSHYVFLMSIANPDECMFYEVEAFSRIGTCAP